METLLFSDQFCLFTGDIYGPSSLLVSWGPLADACHSTETKLVVKTLPSSPLHAGHRPPPHRTSTRK